MSDTNIFIRELANVVGEWARSYNMTIFVLDSAMITMISLTPQISCP
jgi:hypothetical protein